MKTKRIQFPLTISKEGKKIFDDFIQDNKVNKSKLVEWILINYIDNFNK